MARVTVWVPDALDRARRAHLGHVRLSSLVQDAIRERLDCEHQQLACAVCDLPVDRSALLSGAVVGFYRDSLAALEPLVARVGTAEGAARVLKATARRWDLPGVEMIGLPRPSRSQLEEAGATKYERHAGRSRRILPPG